MMELKRRQNGKKSKVGLIVVRLGRPCSIRFRAKILDSIQNCLLYSAIRNSALSDLGEGRYQDFTEEIRKA